MKVEFKAGTSWEFLTSMFSALTLIDLLMSYQKHFSFLHLRVLLTAQADGNSHSSCQRAHSLINTAAKKWEGKKGENIIDWLSLLTEQKHHPRAGWEGHHQLEGSRESASPGQSSAFKASKSNPLIPPKKIKQKAIICLRLRILSLFHRKSNSSSLP